jgi:hypothetical protein
MVVMMNSWSLCCGVCEKMVGAQCSAAVEVFGFQDPCDGLAEGFYLENDFKHEEAIIRNVEAIHRVFAYPGLIYAPNVLARAPYRRNDVFW